jgi:hypothetical protein
MPYKDGKRISNDQWVAEYGTIAMLHTGPNGENPAEAPVLEDEVPAQPIQKAKKAAASKVKAKKAAIENALGADAAADVDLEDSEEAES